MRRTARTALVCFLAATAALAPSLAEADTWPVHRHDASRTGASAGTIPLTAPHVGWRAYAGGRPTASTMRFGLGAPEIVVSAVGGRLVAKNVITHAEAWQSETLGEATVVGVFDLDGAPGAEVVARTSARAYVLDGATGAVRWASPADAIEIMGAVLVRDLDGDGLPDLYLDNGVGPRMGLVAGLAYSFAGGAATELWQLSHDWTPTLLASGSDAFVDLEGDGRTQLVLTSWTSARLLDASDGSVITTLSPAAPEGNPYPHARSLHAQLDGAGARELLIVQPTAHEGTQMAPTISAFSVDVDGGTSAELWTVGLGSYDGELLARADMVVDLDGDGASEVVFASRIGAAWTTRVLDGATGALRAELAGERFEGAADLDVDGLPELVTAAPGAVRVHAWAGSTLALRGSWSGVRALQLEDAQAERLRQPSARLAVLPRAGARPLLIVGTPTGAGDPLRHGGGFWDVRGLELGPQGLASEASFAPLAGEISGAVRADEATRPYAQLAVGSTDGRVTVLDRQLQPTNGIVWAGQPPSGTLIGGGLLRTAPLVGEDAEGPFVALTGTTHGLKVFDVTEASLVVPPVARWNRPGMHAPLVTTRQGVVQVVGVEGEALVSRRATDGALAASVPLPLGRPFGSPIPLRVAGEADPRVGIDWWTDGYAIVQHAVDLESASVAWAAEPILYGGYYGSGAGDLDGDGTDEWYSHHQDLRRRDAATGASTVLGTFSALAYSMPMVAPFASAPPQLLLQATNGGPALLDAAASLLWEGARPEPLNAALGAASRCADAARFVTPAIVSAGIYAYDGTTGALTAQAILAQGAAFPSRAAAAAVGAIPGELSSVNAVADVGGAGPSVLVGSSDGFVYVLDPCDLSVRWAADLGASTGEPVPADVDGDGVDEIVVAAADGFVYGLDTPNGQAPLITLVGAGPDGALALDAGQQAEIAWTAVDGASHYEVALLGPDDEPLWSPAYRQVAATSVTLELDGALPNRPYRVAVRAKLGDGAGPEGFAGSIRVVDAEPPSATLEASGGSTAWLGLRMSDTFALGHYLLGARAADGTVWPLRDDRLEGTEATRTVAWVPDAGLWGSDVVVSLAVVDAGGARTVSELVATIDEAGVVSFGAALPEAPPHDPDDPLDPPGGGDPSNVDPTLEPSGGCSVGAGRLSGAPPGVPLGILAGVLVVLRRRERALARRRGVTR